MFDSVPIFIEFIVLNKMKVSLFQLLIFQARAATKKAERRGKKCDGPKKAKSAYTFFYKEEYKRVHERHPEMSFADVSKEVGRLWSELDAVSKAPFEEMASADKERHNLEMESYPGTSAVAKKVAKEKPDPNAPKKPKTAYNFYRMEQSEKVRNEFPEKTHIEVTKEVAARWAQVGPEDRKPWDMLAAEDRCRFEKETAAYKEAKED